MSHDQSRRSKWSHEQVENSNPVDRFFEGANGLVTAIVFVLVCALLIILFSTDCDYGLKNFCTFRVGN